LSKKQTHILIIGISLADATAADEGKKVVILTKPRGIYFIQSDE